MKLLLFYAVLAAGLYGMLYGIPEFKAFRVKHKRRIVLAVSLPLLIICVIYFLEVNNA